MVINNRTTAHCILPFFVKSVVALWVSLSGGWEWGVDINPKCSINQQPFVGQSGMQAVLIVNVNSAREENCGSQVVQVLKLSSLVLLTYGLMVAMFALSLAFERVETPISSGYKDGGGILLGLFILEVTMWGIAWCWGAGKREALRRSIVDRQLAQIRAMEQAEEERDLAEEKRMIEERRHMMNR